MRPFTIPKEEIKLAAKAGFLTKEIWKRQFANNLSRSWAYKRWKDLLKREIFIPYGRLSRSDIVRLNPESPIVRSITFGDISRAPSHYLLYHDSLVIEAMMNLKRKGKIDDYYFEPEIKRTPAAFDLENCPKFPDAITYKNKEKIAFEVELVTKSKSRYRKALNFYAGSDFTEVYYFVDSSKVSKSISRVAHEIQYPQHRIPLRSANIENIVPNPALGY